MTARSHIRFFVVGTARDLDWWQREHPAVAVVHVPLDPGAARAALAAVVVNPWDQMVHLPSWHRLPAAARTEVWNAVIIARAKGRRLTPAEQVGGAA